MLVLYKPVVDVFIYVLGGLDENEIMLQSVLLGFVEAVSSGLKYAEEILSDAIPLLLTYDYVHLEVNWNEGPLWKTWIWSC